MALAVFEGSMAVETRVVLRASMLCCEQCSVEVCSFFVCMCRYPILSYACAGMARGGIMYMCFCLGRGDLLIAAVVLNYGLVHLWCTLHEVNLFSALDLLDKNLVFVQQYFCIH